MSNYELRQAAMQHFGIAQASRMSIEQIKHWYNNHKKSTETQQQFIPVLTQKVG